MNLIDRYVYAVGKYLPQEIRNDVLKELRTNIEDMLPENYTEKDVYKILEEMGSPLKLANEYNPRKRYLIGPGYFDKYLAVLKTVVGICINVSIVIAIISSVVNPSEIALIDKVVEVFTNVLTGALVGTMQGAFWVTLIFVILERSGVEAGHLPFYNEKWTPDLLPKVSMDNQLKISRGETVFSIICTIISTALLYLQPQLIALYIKGENGVMNTTPLFNMDRLKAYMIYIFTLTVFQLGIFAWKYIAERWNIPLIICNSIYNVLMCILVVVMLRDNALFNEQFVPAIVDFTKGSIQTIEIWFDKGKWIFAGFFIAASALDSITTLYKYSIKR